MKMQYSTDGESAVGILLATHNSERFLLPQLHSIASSNGGYHITIYISDDDSRDGTHDVIKGFCETTSDDSQVEVALATSPGVGILENFSALMNVAIQTDINVFFFCDHDDIWDSQKITKSAEKLHTTCGGSDSLSSIPCLVFTDLAVIDSQANFIASSFADFQGLPSPGSQGLADLLHQNVVTGCTCCFNRELLNVCHPLPSSIVMHDHWIALCAKVFGVWHYIDEPLVNYRQHQANAIGAKRRHDKGLKQWVDPVFLTALRVFPSHLAQAIEQAKSLLIRMDEHRNLVNAEDYELVKCFSTLEALPLHRRWKVAFELFFRERVGLERMYLALVLAILPFMRVQRGSTR